LFLRGGEPLKMVPAFVAGRSQWPIVKPVPDQRRIVAIDPAVTSSVIDMTSLDSGESRT
jgi:hypothetical protein